MEQRNDRVLFDELSRLGNERVMDEEEIGLETQAVDRLLHRGADGVERNRIEFDYVGD